MHGGLIRDHDRRRLTVAAPHADQSRASVGRSSRPPSRRVSLALAARFGAVWMPRALYSLQLVRQWDPVMRMISCEGGRGRGTRWRLGGGRVCALPPLLQSPPHACDDLAAVRGQKPGAADGRRSSASRAKSPNGAPRTPCEGCQTPHSGPFARPSPSPGRPHRPVPVDTAAGPGGGGRGESSHHGGAARGPSSEEEPGPARCCIHSSLPSHAPPRTPRHHGHPPRRAGRLGRPVRHSERRQQGRCALQRRRLQPGGSRFPGRPLQVRGGRGDRREQVLARRRAVGD